MKATTLALLASEALVAAALPNLNVRHHRLQPRASASAYCSSSDSKYKLSEVDGPVSGGGGDGGDLSTWDLKIDDSSAGHRQTVVGFGAAVTDATVSVFSSLSADKRSELLGKLMTDDGASFKLLRHTIASSDLSADPSYSYDDSDEPDEQLAGFGLGDRGNAMASLLADMRKLQPDLKLLGSPWAPPGWMQLDGKLDGTTENNNLNHDYADAFAKYFVKYLQAYEDAGAHVDAITIQNEPLNSQAGYPTMYIYEDESASLIKENVGPALRAAGLNTEVWAYDHNTDAPSYPQAVLDAASDFVPAVAWHCYAADNSWSVLSDFHAANPGVAQYMTECWTSPSTGWSQAADFAMGPLQNWASGALAWTLGSDGSYGPHLSSGGCASCRGLVVVEGDSYEFAVDYYMLAQFSRFLAPGATVLAGEGSYSYEDGTGIESVAAVNPDGSRTVVIENKFGNDVYVTLTTESGEEWSGRVYKESVVTWVLPSSS